jgi:protein-S-isoprenylcysteine O-methyltransferase Ste14
MSGTLASMVNLAQRHRVLVSRVLLGLTFPIILFTRLTWTEQSVLGFVVEEAGFVSIIVGAFGRVWAMLYLAGRKGKELVTTGPYSICRNPLYFFNLLIGLGIVATFQNLLLLPPLVLLYPAYYLLAILGEESELAQRFGADFENYRRAVPRLIPLFWRYSRGGTEGWLTVRESRSLKCLFESALFVLVIPFAEVIEQLHACGILPLIFKK